MNRQTFADWRLELVALGLVAVLLILLTSCGAVPPPGPAALPPVAPVDIRGEGVAWTVPGLAQPPARASDDELYPGNQILTGSCIGYLNDYWPTAGTGNIQVSRYVNCLNQYTAQVKLPDGSTPLQAAALEVPQGFLDPNGAGTEALPYNKPYLPAWMDNDSYRQKFYVASEDHWYWGLIWNGPFRDRMVEFIQTVGAALNGDPQIGVVRVYVGFQGESQPNRACETYWPNDPPNSNVGCPDNITAVFTAHEALPGASCAHYIAFIDALGEAAYTAFPAHPVVVMMGVAPCANKSGWRLRRDLYTAWHDEGKQIGLSVNALAPDWSGADSSAGNVSDGWYIYDSGPTLQAWNMPVLFEYGFNPGHGGSCIGNAECRQYMYWAAMEAVTYGGRWALHHSTWNGYYNAWLWELNDWLFNSERRVSIWFSGPECAIWNWSVDAGTGCTGQDRAKYLQWLNTANMAHACNAKVKARADQSVVDAWAAGAIWVIAPCDELLPTPAAPQTAQDEVMDRQAMRLPAYSSHTAAVLPDWQYYGTEQEVRVTVTYFDLGTDSFDIRIPSGSSSVHIETINKFNFQHWFRHTYTQTAYIINSLNTPDGWGFISVLPNVGDDILHEVFVEVIEPGGGPIITPTPTPTPTPIATPTPIGSRDQPVRQINGTPTLDGLIGEWSNSDLPHTLLYNVNADYADSRRVRELDASVTGLWATWDASYLYLAFRVNDQSQTTDDYLALGFTTTADGSGPVFDIRFLVNAGPAPTYAEDRFTGTNLPVGMQSWHYYNPGYYYSAEARIPLASIGGPVAGSRYRFSYALADSDVEGTAELARWTTAGKNFAEDAFDPGWGTLVFDAQVEPWTRAVPMISEVFYNQGSPCVDYNLRGGCTPGDQFVEIAFPGGWVTAGYALTAGSCSYTFADDSVTLGRKVVWGDMLREPTGVACTGLAAGEYVQLIDIDGYILQAILIGATGVGQSWTAQPGAGWAEATPSPGY